MSQEPTDTPQPRGSRGPASRGTARGRAGLGGRPRLEAPTSRHLALTGTDTAIPAPPSSTTIPNSGDADDLPAPLSLTTIPGSGRADDSGTRLEEDLLAANAVGTRELVTVSSLQPAAPPAPSGDGGTRPSGTPDAQAVGLTTARAVPPCLLPSGMRAPTRAKRDADIFDETSSDCRRFLGPLQDSTRETTLVAQPRHSADQVRQTWFLEKQETVRHLREIAAAGSPGRPWTANFQSECLCLPVVTDPVALQVDLEELSFSGGPRDFTSVIATLQTMMHDAGYAFLNLVLTWGRTLSPELLAAQAGQFMSDVSCLWRLLMVEQVAWNEIARGRHYSVRRDGAPFQTLDSEVASAFPVEEDGDTLMLTSEEQELLGTAMVTRLRLAHVRPRDWSESDTSRPEPKRRRGSTDAPLSVHSWPGSDEDTRVWGGPIPEVVGTSSLASGDALMLTPDENMSSAGGGSQGSPGLEPSAAMVGVYMATTGSGTGQPYTAEQPTLYVPVAEYPPNLREADRQISELRAASAARDGQERIQNEEYRAAQTAQATQAKLSQEVWEYREAGLQERAARKTERRKAADQEFASPQAKVYVLEKERAQEREEGSSWKGCQKWSLTRKRHGQSQLTPRPPLTRSAVRRSPSAPLRRSLTPQDQHETRRLEVAILDPVRHLDSPSGHLLVDPGGPTLRACRPVLKRVFGSVDASASRPGDSHPWESGGPGAFGFPAAGGYAPGYGVSFRPFIAYDAVEPFDTSLSLDKRRAWWTKFQYTASSGGWREKELCIPVYSRLSHNPGTKAWVQQLPESARRSWRQLSDRFYKGFCRSTESPVERYLRLKQESRETPRAFLWRLNAAATKANVDFHSASGCRRHVNQFLKNLRDRELQLSLQGRVYFTTDELDGVHKQVEEMKQGMRRKPANDVQFGRHKPQGVEPQAPDTEDLRWEDEDDSGYGYQYDEENDEAYDGLVDQEEVSRRSSGVVEWPQRAFPKSSRPQGRRSSRSSQTLCSVPRV
ncbi:hypothetical protein PHMEG_00018298 [Phytophthora megakarya]|uniref:Retrotransposon gag domain-containing protein n=1 Tax=Phytophthora megakarya TaxID=4795 RepID=A0A225VVP6_9STRA|nr:hypothetical protein PHMEG_00018298 [Phytophthora megakarya]